MSDRSESELQEPTHFQMLEELQQAKMRAERATEAKSQFLAQMSHEIRTPLTAMLGYVDLLSDFDLTLAERSDVMDALRNNGRHLLRLLDDILDLSRVESGQLSVERINCRTGEILQEVMRLTRPRAELKGLSLVLETHPQVPHEIQTDPTRLRQILANLISNALKFTTRGQIRLIVRPASDGPGVLVFEVIDQGIGISETQQQRLFQPYAQADETVYRRFGGTGLGLAISQQLAKMLGGSITCQSTLGQGSTFTVTIATGLTQDQPECEESPQKLEECSSEDSAVNVPRENIEDLPPAPMPLIPALVIHSRGVESSSAGTLRAPKILVADDHPDNLQLVAYMLRKCGARVEEATDGQVAVDKILQTSEADPFDLVLMDMKMPELDGYAATKRLRDLGYTGRIVALTAQTMSGDRDRCLIVGCDDYLSKPIAPEVFWRVLSQHLNVDPPLRRVAPFPNGVG